MTLKSVNQFPVTGRRVFLRVDFNVPREKGGGKILDDTRICEAIPTIRYLIEQKAKVILASHLGRPKGRDPEESLIGVAERLTELLGCEVIFPEDCVGDGVWKLAHDLREGQVLLLENLRFHKEEELNEPDFAAALAHLGEVYVTDAFGALHRAHASTVGMVSQFKEKGIGFLVQKELDFLGKLLARPERPFVAVLGGAKVSDKIGLIENLLSKVDEVLLGGALAYTFLKAEGIPTGKSRLEEEKINQARRILMKGKEAGVAILLPRDHRVADRIASDAISKVVDRIGGEDIGLDIGPETSRQYAGRLQRAKTIFWNGPMGFFEIPAFAAGTREIAAAIASAGAVSVVGGGESLAAIRSSGLGDKISHLSTGGGATLEYLEGKELPGLKVLET